MYPSAGSVAGRVPRHIKGKRLAPSRIVPRNHKEEKEIYQVRTQADYIEIGQGLGDTCIGA
jgi:hypothetical protein